MADSDLRWEAGVSGCVWHQGAKPELSRALFSIALSGSLVFLALWLWNCWTKSTILTIIPIIVKQTMTILR